MKYKVICFVLAFFTLLLVSCSQMLSSSDQYYFQQQNASDKDGSIGGPNVDWPDDDDAGGSGTVPPLEAGQISMFSALQSNGVVSENAVLKVAGKMGGTDSSYTGYQYNTAKFEKWQVLGSFTSANVPSLWYASDSLDWGAISTDGYNMQSVGGPNTTAGSNSITGMRYYRYDGVNPFFAHDSSYNTVAYPLYNQAGTDPTGTEETFMKRFHFYRFTGKGGGVAAIDNWLVAVDTYTKLVFSFAKPTKWGSLLGNALPLEWGPVDLVSTGPGGLKYKFYEYDPAGYVAEDGKFHMTPTYMSSLGAGNYDPAFTGISPYLGVADGTEDGGSSGGGATGGVAVSGVLTVKAKYLKNISMTDAWGDHGNGDGTDKPEFIYSVRSRAYSGFDEGKWNVMSSYKPDDPGINPSSAKTIQKGTSLQLGGGKQYEFSSITGGLTLELDSRIIEIDIIGNDELTNFESPIIFLGYDRYSQNWTPTIDNDTYLRGPLEYDENFQVGLGETKDFIITIPAGSGSELELCYEISWESDGNTADGRIFSAQTKNIGTDYQFSGSNGVYALEYSDLTEASSKEDKTATIEISLGNLDPDVPVIVNYNVDNTVSGFIGQPTFNSEILAFATISDADPTLKIKIPLLSNPTQSQEGTLTLTFVDESGLNVYDAVNSPDKIIIAITRDQFIPADTGVLNISNVTLKNLSVMDVGGDQPSGGYDQPEFSWSMKTRHIKGENTGEWGDLSTNTGMTVIKTNATHALSEIKTHEIENPREGLQIIEFSAEITERDVLAGNDDDVIMKHEQPLIKFKYNPLSDSWNVTGKTSFYYTNGTDMQWQIKKVTMNDAKRNEGAQTVTISLSSYIYDTIWPSDNIADFINGPITAGWGDMELTFDITWSDLNEN